MTRAAVIVMTFNSTAIGVLLALPTRALPWDLVLALFLGTTLAHATNNLINDWVDHRLGVDHDNYFRRRYGTHVLEDGLIRPAVYAGITVVTGLVALMCGAYILMQTTVTSEILTLILLGSFFVVFYTWPLKHFALGEFAVLIVWGPLMTMGSYYVLTESLSLEVFWFSLLAGIGPTLVIMGKHMDKIADDNAATIRTLPVALGLINSLWLCRGLIIALWGLWLMLTFEHWSLILCLAAVPRAWQLFQILGKPSPTAPPKDYPETVWPLWYAAAAFSFARSFGLYFLVAVIISNAL